MRTIARPLGRLGPFGPFGPLGRGLPRPSARWRRDDGMSTAEYAVGLLAVVTLATVLYGVVTSQGVSDALQGAVEEALRIRP
ncbi:DUF4244 domain-containing protein [Streptomyces radicis]|uniref:DUF4244 domain-containing protein n=1 Tax=Streptomyces radicis TaxID=1750517 RepID=A0A3A9WBX7_9ACTN|nr:DUF4244 domain-containing protein [Streptomyces radicis]RKN10152.1 DUF4244 domain-containing protein [Streptomyces radicis]RKN24494.1 DUF4244 domain-containing protein [Streptomyces radicis]